MQADLANESGAWIQQLKIHFNNERVNFNLKLCNSNEECALSLSLAEWGLLVSKLSLLKQHINIISKNPDKRFLNIKIADDLHADILMLAKFPTLILYRSEMGGDGSVLRGCFDQVQLRKTLFNLLEDAVEIREGAFSPQ